MQWPSRFATISATKCSAYSKLWSQRRKIPTEADNNIDPWMPRSSNRWRYYKSRRDTSRIGQTRTHQRSTIARPCTSSMTFFRSRRTRKCAKREPNTRRSKNRASRAFEVTNSRSCPCRTESRCFRRITDPMRKWQIQKEAPGKQIPVNIFKEWFKQNLNIMTFTLLL